MGKIDFGWTARKLGKTWRIDIIIGEKTPKGVNATLILTKRYRGEIPPSAMQLMEDAFGSKRYVV